MPAARIRPAASTATQSQRDSTSSITWEEKTTVAPEAVYRSSTVRMVCAETGSTPSNGSSRKSTSGLCSSAEASPIFLRMPVE